MKKLILSLMSITLTTASLSALVVSCGKVVTEEIAFSLDDNLKSNILNNLNIYSWNANKTEIVEKINKQENGELIKKDSEINPLSEIITSLREPSELIINSFLYNPKNSSTNIKEVKRMKEWMSIEGEQGGYNLSADGIFNSEYENQIGNKEKQDDFYKKFKDLDKKPISLIGLRDFESSNINSNEETKARWETDAFKNLMSNFENKNISKSSKSRLTKIKIGSSNGVINDDGIKYKKLNLSNDTNEIDKDSNLDNLLKAGVFQDEKALESFLPKDQNKTSKDLNKKSFLMEEKVNDNFFNNLYNNIIFSKIDKIEKSDNNKNIIIKENEDSTIQYTIDENKKVVFDAPNNYFKIIKLAPIQINIEYFVPNTKQKFNIELEIDNIYGKFQLQFLNQKKLEKNSKESNLGLRFNFAGTQFNKDNISELKSGEGWNGQYFKDAKLEIKTVTETK